MKIAKKVLLTLLLLMLMTFTSYATEVDATTIAAESDIMLLAESTEPIQLDFDITQDTIDKRGYEHMYVCWSTTYGAYYVYFFNAVTSYTEADTYYRAYVDGGVGHGPIRTSELLQGVVQGTSSTTNWSLKSFDIMKDPLYDIFSTYTLTDESGAVLAEKHDWVSNGWSSTEPPEEPETGEGEGETDTDGILSILSSLKGWFQSVIDSITSLQKKLQESISSVTLAITELPDKIMESIKAFFPDPAVVKDMLFQVKTNFDSFFSSIKAPFEEIFSIAKNVRSTPPVVKIKLNQSKYFSQDEEVTIDFSFYEDIREDVEPFLSAFIMLSYLWLLFKRLPGIIVGSSMRLERKRENELGGTWWQS